MLAVQNGHRTRYSDCRWSPGRSFPQYRPHILRQKSKILRQKSKNPAAIDWDRIEIDTGGSQIRRAHPNIDRDADKIEWDHNEIDAVGPEIRRAHSNIDRDA